MITDPVHKAATDLLNWLDQATWDDAVSEDAVERAVIERMGGVDG